MRRYANVVARIARTSLIVVAASLLGLAAAGAEDAAGPGGIGRFETVRVRPVVLASPDATLVPVRLALAVQGGVASRERVDAALTAAHVDAEGMGFAGASTPQDVAALQTGLLVATLPLAESRGAEKLAEAGRLIQRSAEGLPGLQPASRERLQKLAERVAAGTVDGDAVNGVVRAATEGMGEKGKERVHGYLLVGIWTGLCTLAAAIETGDADLANMGSALALMLEKDADFGGSDRKLAAEVRKLAAEMRAETPAPEQILAGVAAVLQARPDRP